MGPPVRPLSAVLAVVAAIILIVSVVFLPESAVYANVPADALTGVGLNEMTNAVAIVDDGEAVAALRAAVTDEAQALDGGPPFVVVTVAMSGDSRWCRRLSVDYHVGASGALQMVLSRPWRARILGAGCTEDAPAPGAVIVSVPAQDLAAAEQVMVDFDVVSLGPITCACTPQQGESDWSCAHATVVRD